MMFSPLRQLVQRMRKALRRGRQGRAGKRGHFVRPRLEGLEDRCVPATVTWNGNAGDFNFDTAGNWDLNRVPNMNDDAVINTTGITVTHSSTVTDTVHSLTSRATFNLTGGTLSVTSALTLIGNLTVGNLGTLSVGPNVNVQVGSPTNPSSVTLADNGTLSFGANDAVTLNSNNSFLTGTTTAQIVVSGVSNGTVLTASGTTFAAAGTGVSQVVVNDSGHLTATGCTFALRQFTLGSGSIDTLTRSAVSGIFTINSGATVSISGNNFNGLGANGVMATGSPSATIDLTNNYWGTTDSTQIAAKILDHTDDSRLPTVLYTPFLSVLPPPQLHFINFQGGDWGTAANWDIGRVPRAGDTVVIDTPGIT